MDTAVQQIKNSGTRFRLFPQAPFVDSDREPETVVVSCPAGTVEPGPADARMYTVFPAGKEKAYGYHDGAFGPYMLLPPWQGEIYAPAMPDSDGHFDHIPVDTREFQLAHLFGCTRFVLDIWEQYFGYRIPWHFESSYRRLELVILPHFQNAQVGYGFLETGSNTTKEGFTSQFCLNFDVVAHEVGHAIIYSQVGTPADDEQTGEYYGFHESSADLTAIISVLHFDSILNELLENTSGNLYSYNRLNRVAELSDNEQIRLAANPLTMHDFVDGWRDSHKLAQPFTGAMFDIFIDIFHELLLSRGLISAYLEDLADELEYIEQQQSVIQEKFDLAYVKDPQGFKQALVDARDTMGHYLAETWRRVSAGHLSYASVVDILLDIDQAISEGLYRKLILRNVLRRGIGSVEIGPQLEKLSENDHMHASRMVEPDEENTNIKPRLSYYSRMQLARQAV